MSLIYYMSEIKPWKKLSTEIVINNDRLKIRKDVCLLPDGTILPDFYVREDKDVAIVFCLTKNKEVILVRQYRHGAGGEGEITLELPAGLKDSHDHSIEDTARRELLEETGYACDIMQKKAEWLLTATSTAHVFVFTGLDADKISAPKHSAGEVTEIELVPLDQLADQVTSGKIRVAVHIAALYYMLGQPVAD